MTPAQVKPTLSSALSSIDIDWNDPDRGQRLREAYWRKRGYPSGPPTPLPKRVSPEGRAATWRRFCELRRATVPGGLMRELHALGRLHGFKVRVLRCAAGRNHR